MTVSVMARSTIRKDPTSFGEGPVNHPRFGRGQRFVGTQMLTNAVTTASDGQLWTGTAPTAVASINVIKISPDIFNSRLALFAQTYARYRFTRIEVEYEPLVASTAIGGFALCVVPDSMIDGTATYSYSAAQEVTPSLVCPFRERGTLVYTVPLSNDELWYTEYDGATTAGARLSAQCALLGYPSSSSLGATTQGTFRLRYVIECYNPVSSEAIVSLVRTTKKERELLNNFLDKIRQDVKDVKVAVESKESKDPLSSQRVQCSQSSSSVLSSLSPAVSSGGFQNPRLDERYLLVGSNQRQ